MAVWAMLLVGFVAPGPAEAKWPWPDEKIVRYDAPRATGPITVDGRVDEPAWQAAPRSPRFVDLVTGERRVHDTRAAIVWDETHLYVAFWVEEPLVRAKYTERDAPLYRDNDVELFIGGADAYYELEINAHGTIYEKLFVWQSAYDEAVYGVEPTLRPAGLKRFDGVEFRPHPRGPRWMATHYDLPGLQVKVHVDGTLNDDTDRDRGWTAEIAIPWRSLRWVRDDRALPPKAGDTWRMDLSRFNQYREAGTRDRGGWAMSAHGVWDSHVPEVWPYVRFVDTTPPRKLR